MVVRERLESFDGRLVDVLGDLDHVVGQYGLRRDGRLDEPLGRQCLREPHLALERGSDAAVVLCAQRSVRAEEEALCAPVGFHGFPSTSAAMS